MIRHTTTEPSRPVLPMLCLLLFQAAIPAAHAAPPLKPGPSAAHDASHPLVLSRDADFLVPLLALHKEALSVSKVAAKQAVQPRIRDYATRAVRGQIAALEKLVRKYAGGEKPDFHIMPMPEEMQRLPGSTIGERYLRIMIRLLSEKIELAEFASGTASISHSRRIAARTIAAGYGDLMILSRWLEQITPWPE